MMSDIYECLVACSYFLTNCVKSCALLFWEARNGEADEDREPVCDVAAEVCTVQHAHHGEWDATKVFTWHLQGWGFESHQQFVCVEFALSFYVAWIFSGSSCSPNPYS